jgi:Mg2+ and Co2+ transporter CorA
MQQKSQDRRTVQYHFQEVHISSGGVFNPNFGNDQADSEALNAATLLDKLAQLEDRLGVIAKTVNEEIQLFIASVSIPDSEVMLADSKIMREDSQIMKQQAARTTLLTTLAVIYLPLQLITGIFGMNIREITGDGGPRWWACLAALGAGGVLTFLVYLAVKWWQRRASQRKVREGEKEKEV